MTPSSRGRPARAIRIASVAVACAGLVAIPAPAAETAHVHVIDGGDPFFDPFETVIRRGDTVEWDNHADRLHTVTHVTCRRADSRYDDCELDSEADPETRLFPGRTFTHTFAARSGIFDYKCTIHGFTGRVVVLDETGALPDLTVESLTAHDTASPASKRLEATIRNVGEAAISATNVSFQYRNYDGAWIDIGEPKAPALNAGGSVVVNQPWLVANKAGDFGVRVIADSGRNQVEGSEENNVREETIAVWLPPGTIPGVSLPEPP